MVGASLFVGSVEREEERDGNGRRYGGVWMEEEERLPRRNLGDVVEMLMMSMMTHRVRLVCGLVWIVDAGGPDLVPILSSSFLNLSIN